MMKGDTTKFSTMTLVHAVTAMPNQWSYSSKQSLIQLIPHKAITVKLINMQFVSTIVINVKIL